MIPTTRGAMKLLLDNAVFIRNKKWGDSAHWVCRRKSHGCKMTVLTNGTNVTKIKGEHSHH